MISKTVRLWAHNAADLQTLKGLMTAEFGAQTHIADKGAYVWRNTGAQREDTRVGMTKAQDSDLNNPTLRYLAETSISGDEALITLSQKLAAVAAALPAKHVGSFATGTAIVMTPAQAAMETQTREQEEPALACA